MSNGSNGGGIACIGPVRLIGLGSVVDGGPCPGTAKTWAIGREGSASVTK